MENIPESNSKTWLQRLKNESWEAELLVSAVAIFAVLNSFSALKWLVIKFIDHLDPSQYNIAYSITVGGYIAAGILASMFSIHFALRAYWIGLVGLNSVFPDYGLEDSAYSPIYTKKILKVLPKISNSITKIDDLCSVIFSAAFAFMLIYLYATILAILYLSLFNLLYDFLPLWLLLAPAILAAIGLVIGTLISIPANLKRFHNNETIQHLYFLYARWIAFFMYGPFYKSIFQITMLFGSNFKKKKGMVKMVIFMLIAGLFFGMAKMFDSNFKYLLTYSREQDTTTMQPSLFANNNKNKSFLLNPEINAHLIRTSTITLFIPIFKHEVSLLETACSIEKTGPLGDKKPEERHRIRSIYLDCYNKQTKVFVDDRPVEISFLKTNHAITGQFGISGFVDLKKLNNGLHELRIEKTLTNENEKKWQIPFYYNPN